VVHADALEFLQYNQRSYDVIFVDPPYAFWEQAGQSLTLLFARLAQRLTPAAGVYLEAPRFPELPSGWRPLKCSRAGAVHFQLLQHEANLE